MNNALKLHDRQKDGIFCNLEHTGCVEHRCRTHRWLTLKLIALMIYDYLLTMGDEVELIWRRKMSTSSWIFITNRLVLIIFVVVASFQLDRTVEYIMS